MSKDFIVHLHDNHTRFVLFILDENDKIERNMIMKKKISGLLLVVVSSILLVGCADIKVLIQEPEHPSSQMTTSLKETHKSEVPKSARIVEPIPAVLSVDNLDNCTFAASFNPSHVYLNDDGDLVVHMTVYDYELFDQMEVSELEEGDTLVINRNEMVVKSIERYKGASYIAINGGLEEGGCYLTPNETGVYFEVGMNAAKSYYEIGEVTLPVSEEFTFIDNSGSENSVQKLYAGDFLMEIENSDISFSQYATTVTVEKGFITNITNVFVP